MNLPQETKDKFFRYEELKLKAKEVEEELKKLALDLVQVVKPGETVLGHSGKFTVRETTRWEYSDDVKRLQVEEKAKGIAKPVTSTALYYNPDKKEGSFEDEFGANLS